MVLPGDCSNMLNMPVTICLASAETSECTGAETGLFLFIVSIFSINYGDLGDTRLKSATDSA